MDEKDKDAARIKRANKVTMDIQQAIRDAEKARTAKLQEGLEELAHAMVETEVNTVVATMNTEYREKMAALAVEAEDQSEERGNLVRIVAERLGISIPEKVKKDTK